MNSIIRFRFSFFFLTCLLSLASAKAATYYSISSGPWTSSSTWSLTSGGSAISSGYPGVGDNVIVEGGFTVTIAATQSENLYAANLTVGGATTSGTLTYTTSGSTLTISGDFTLGGGSLTATGTLNYPYWGFTIICNRFLKGIGPASRINSDQQDFTFTGSFTLPADPAFVSFRNFIINTGASVTLSQNISTNGSISPKIEAGGQLDMGPYSMEITGYNVLNIQGTLILSGNSGGFRSSNFPTGFQTLTIGNASTVKYNFNGNQNIYPATYANLIVEGAGVKTVGPEGYIASLTVLSGGSGYYSSCQTDLIFSGGGGTGATGGAQTPWWDPNYDSPPEPNYISYAYLNERGSGYTSAPTVTLESYCGGSGASIIANMVFLKTATVNGNFTLGSGSTFSTEANLLTLKGNLINNGSFTGTAAVSMAGTSAQTISGTGSFTHLTINNASGVTINSGANKQTLTGTLTPTAGTLTTNGNLVLKSNASGTARIAQGSGTYISGTVEVERYIATAQRGWRFLTIPVTGATIREAWAGTPANPAAPAGETAGSGTLITGHAYATGGTASAAGFDWFTGLTSGTTSSIRFYNNSTWSSVTNTPNILAAPAKQGYMLYVRGDRTIASGVTSSATTLHPTGELKINTQTIPISDAYEVVGNPYASTVDLDAMYNNSGNSAVIERNFWVWDATLGTSGGFRAISYGASSYAMTGGTGAVADYLKVQSGQAFFVKRLSAGNITLQESNKVGGSNPVIFSEAGSLVAADGQLQLNLFRNSQQLDGSLIRFNDVYQSTATETYDLAKLNNFNENLSLVNGSSYLSIESRPYPSSKDTVKLAFWNLNQSTYTLNLSSSNLSGRIGTALLVDNFTGSRQVIDLTGGTSNYNFTVTPDAASSSLNRFFIIFSQQASLPVSLLQLAATTKPTGIAINWKTAQESTLNRYELERSTDGIAYTKIATVTALNSFNGGSYDWLDIAPLQGNNIYRLKMLDLDASYKYSSVTKAFWSRKDGMELLPTVTMDGRVTLVLRNQPLGSYQLSLFGVNGAKLYTKNIQQNQSSGVYELQLSTGNTQLGQGVYYLEVRNGVWLRKRFTVVKN